MDGATKQIQSCVWLFDRERKSWKEGPSLNKARYSLGSCAIRDRIYVFAGSDSKNRSIAETEIHAVGTKSGWKILAGREFEFKAPVVAQLNSDEIIIMGNKEVTVFHIDYETSETIVTEGHY